MILNFYAATSRAPRDALLSTYCELAKVGGLTPFPMSKESARRIFGSLRAAGYRTVHLGKWHLSRLYHRSPGPDGRYERSQWDAGIRGASEFSTLFLCGETGLVYVQ